MKFLSVLLATFFAAAASATFVEGGYLLDGKCDSDDDCQKRCHDKSEWQKPGFLPEHQVPYIDRYAQFLTGTCNWNGTGQCGCNASDDTACDNIFPKCRLDYKGCRPKAKQSTDRANFLCDCPLVCNESDGHTNFAQ